LIYRSPTPPLIPYTTLFRSMRVVPFASVHALAPCANHLLALGIPWPSPSLPARTFVLSAFTFSLSIGDLASVPASMLAASLARQDRKSTRLNSSHVSISYAV